MTNKTAVSDHIEGIAILDSNCNYLYVNGDDNIQARISQKNVIERALFEKNPPDESDKFSKIYKNVMENRIIHEFEDENTSPDGSKQWFRVCIAPISDGVFISSTDITGKKLEEKRKFDLLQASNNFEIQKLKALYKVHPGIFPQNPKSNNSDLISFLTNANKKLFELVEYRTAELNAIVESIPDAVIIGNSEGIMHCNSKAVKLLGLDSLDELKENLEDLSKKTNLRFPANRIPLKFEEHPVIRALSEKFAEHLLVSDIKTGNDSILHVAGAPVVLNGKVIGGVVIESDISDRIKAEEKLRSALIELNQSREEINQSSLKLNNYIAELENQNETKDLLLSIIAHDLRSPFQALTTACSFLIEEMESLNKNEILLIAEELRKTVKTQFGVVDNLL
jgi:PAS domain S-box-containing protein